MKVGKINPINIGKKMAGAGLGAIAGEIAADKIVDMVESDMAETGALIICAAAGAYIADSQKGIFSDAGTGFAGELTKTVIKKYTGLGGGAEEAPATKKAVKGVDDEIGEIYDEINKALEVRGTNEPIITGSNDPLIMGMDEVEGFDED